MLSSKNLKKIATTFNIPYKNKTKGQLCNIFTSHYMLKYIELNYTFNNTEENIKIIEKYSNTIVNSFVRLNCSVESNKIKIYIYDKGNLFIIRYYFNTFVGNNPDIALTPILTSSTNATVTGMAPVLNLGMYKNYGKTPELVADPENENNKICIAGLAEGMFKSHFRNRIVDAFAKSKEIKYLDKSNAEGKVILIGNGRFLANEYDSILSQTGSTYQYRPKKNNDLQFSQDLINLKISHFFGNQEFFQNMTDYMMGDNSVLDIRSRQIDIHEIDKEKVIASAGFFRILNIALPVILILLLSLLITYRRRKKYSN